MTTPTPEAIEAGWAVFAERAGIGGSVPAESSGIVAAFTAALTAAAPFIAAQAKAEALREAADEFRNCPDWGYRATRTMATEDYLRARAATIEGTAS